MKDNWAVTAPAPSAEHDVKIFGERNTATNALKQVIETNSSSSCFPSTMPELNPGLARFNPTLRRLSAKLAEAQIDHVFKYRDADRAWKHCATNFADASALAGKLVLFTVRHPGSWLMSFYRNPYHIFGKRPASVSEFIDFSWRTVKRERLDEQVFTPLALYCEKIRSYKAFASLLDRDGISYRLIRFEDLILDQRSVFAGIRSLLRSPTDNFTELSRATKNAAKSLEYYKQYYGAELWRDDLAGLEARIDSRVDWSLLEDFDYRPMSA